MSGEKCPTNYYITVLIILVCITLVLVIIPLIATVLHLRSKLKKLENKRNHKTPKKSNLIKRISFKISKSIDVSNKNLQTTLLGEEKKYDLPIHRIFTAEENNLKAKILGEIKKKISEKIPNSENKSESDYINYKIIVEHDIGEEEGNCFLPECNQIIIEDPETDYMSAISH